MTLSKEKPGDCPPPRLHLHPPPPHPNAMATHQPLYQHRFRFQLQSTEDDEGAKMESTGHFYKEGGAGGGIGVQTPAAAAAAASLVLSHRPTWHIKDEVLPQVAVHDGFEEWLNGYVQRAYSSSCPDAKGHQSGWAMRNTNNHDPKRLKKSCLGVMMCNRKCRNEDGFIVHIRPYICDKARRKQEGIRCPTKGCDGHLYQVKCSGHAGKPVTHIWRTEGSTIYFQAKGEHGHPAPEPKMSGKRPPHRVPIHRPLKESGTKKTNRMNYKRRPRGNDMLQCGDCFTLPPSHSFNSHQDMAIFALHQQHQHQQQQMTNGATSSFMSIIGPPPAFSSTSSSYPVHILPSTTHPPTNPFIELPHDFSTPTPPSLPPPPLSQSTWLLEHEMAPPPRTSGPSSSSLDGAAATGRSAYAFDDPVCASFSPGCAGGGNALLQDSLRDFAFVHGFQQQTHLPAAFCQSSYYHGCDQGFLLNEGSFRCPSGGSNPDSEGEDIDGRLDGSATTVAEALGLIGRAPPQTDIFDGCFMSELGHHHSRQYHRQQQQARGVGWLSSSTSFDLLSPLDHHSPTLSPPTTTTLHPSYAYPTSFQCHRTQLDLQDERTTKASIALHRSFLQQQQQQSPPRCPPPPPPHLSSSSFDQRHQTIASIEGLGTSAPTAAVNSVYFASTDYLPNNPIVRP